MLVRDGQRVLMRLLITGALISPVAACANSTAEAEVTGLVIPSAPTFPGTPPASAPNGGTRTRPVPPSGTSGTSSAGFTALVSPVTTEDVRHTYRPGCPVGPSGLRKVTMTYRSYTGEVRTGMLIVAVKHAPTVVDIFRQAFDAGFRIHRMDNPNGWHGDDEQMMAADNTSAFNCRQVTGNAANLSPHAYGTAIDVNPRRNPYRAANGVWYPPNGTRWVDRSRGDTGMIRSSSTITRAVLAANGTWGGRWADPDYQHFELD